MSVEHDGYDGGDGGDRGDRGQDGHAAHAAHADHADHPDHAAPDPLLALLTDEPLPADADTTARAEYRAAAADVTALREQLRLIGTALGEAGPEPEPEPAKRPRPVARPRPRPRRPLTLALRAAAVLCAATVVSGLAWLVTQASPGGADDSGAEAADKGAAADASQSAAGYLACARLVAEGTVTDVAPVPGTGKERVTLRVTRYYVPDAGPAETVFTMDESVDPRLREGQHALIGIPKGAADPDIWTAEENEIAHERAWISDALPESRTIDCG
ncbi:hypothetical protein [Streptomyces sp. NPDC006997]|uniref:hypothetical protein n=1 Tax=Streptomyces sp. NPDC006997 TaxID=3155356 RepID=UPI003402600D